MKTEDFIGLLAADETGMPVHTVGRRFTVALGCGIPVAVLIMVCVYGVRSDLVQAMGGMMIWIKLSFAGAMAVFASLSTERLGRPGMRLGGVWAGLAMPLILLWFVAMVAIAGAEPQLRADVIFGSTWKSCPFNIALISLPLFAATLWFVRGLAPTHSRQAGASAGLMAGALATLIYSFHCPESSAAFVGIWYVLGISIPTITGAVLGPKFLSW